MYVFEYLRFNFKTQKFVMRLPITAQIIPQKCNAVHSRHEKCVRIIKCVTVRALFVKNKMRFARAEQLWPKWRQSLIGLLCFLLVC